MLETDDQGSQLTYTLYGADGLAGRITRSDGYIAETYDPQGNAIQPVHLYGTSPRTAQVALSLVYDAFGGSSFYSAYGSYSNALNPVNFGGQYGYYKEYSGQYLLGHRYYNAALGRFLTRDPIGYGGGLNLYGYTGNNPVNESDPSGYAPPTKGPFGESINPSQLYTHHPDANHPNLHYDLKIPGNPLSTHPNEQGLREYRFSLETNQWTEKHKSRKRAAARRFRAANLAVNAEERVTKGSMSKASKASFMKNLFTKWGQKIIKVIPDVPGPLEVFDIIPHGLYDGSIQRQMEWESKHPNEKYYEGADGA